MHLFYHKTQARGTNASIGSESQRKRMKNYLQSANTERTENGEKSLKDPISDIEVGKRIALHTRVERRKLSAIMMVQ